MSHPRVSGLRRAARVRTKKQLPDTDEESPLTAQHMTPQTATNSRAMIDGLSVQSVITETWRMAMRITLLQLQAATRVINPRFHHLFKPLMFCVKTMQYLLDNGNESSEGNLFAFFI